MEMKKIGIVCAAALFACMQGQAGSVLDITFGRVWEGRKVFDAEIPFPKGVSFLPAAHYAAKVESLPAELRVEDAAGNVRARFAAPADVAPPYTLHLALACRHRVAVFAEKGGEVRLSRIDDWPEGFDPRPAANLTSLRVVPGGGAGTVAATLSAGIGQADVRFVTRGRQCAPYLEGGRLFFTFSARFFGSALGVGSLDPAAPEKGVRYEGLILFDYGDGILRNDLAAHLFLDDETGEWRGWACNFSTGFDGGAKGLGGRAEGGVNAVWTRENPLHGFHVMRAKPLGLSGMNEDPCGVWDAKAGKWRLFVSAFTKKGIRAQMLESDRWDGGFAPITKTVAENSTGTTIACMGGEFLCLAGSVDRAYYVYSYPFLEMRGKMKLEPTPWGDAKGWPHGRGWPALAELPAGARHRHILLTMDRVNFPGMPKPNWTYGALSIYVGK